MPTFTESAVTPGACPASAPAAVEVGPEPPLVPVVSVFEVHAAHVRAAARNMTTGLYMRVPSARRWGGDGAGEATVECINRPAGSRPGCPKGRGGRSTSQPGRPVLLRTSPGAWLPLRLQAPWSPAGWGPG